jgi:hypothetical protein
MAEHHTPPSLQDYRMGHSPRGVAGRYEHPTPVMVAELMRDLEQRWQVSEGAPHPPPARGEREEMSGSGRVPYASGRMSDPAAGRIGAPVCSRPRDW